jgi:hypothetical protein
MKTWKFKNNKQPTIDECEIFVATKTTLDNIISFLNIPVQSDNFIPAKSPVFDNIPDCARFRSLLAVSLGCDAHFYNIFTPTKITQVLADDSIKEATKPDDAYLAFKKLHFKRIWS